MEVKYCKRVSGMGLFATKKYVSNNVIYTLSGEINNTPDKYSIEIGTNKHITDKLGVYMNHSFVPNVKIQGVSVISLKTIEVGDEICFNYNENETCMSCPFETPEGLVSGKIKQ